MTLLGGSGAAINVLSATGKQLAKVLKLVGPAGKTAGKIIGTKVSAIMSNPVASNKQKFDALKLLVPFFEISSSVALIYNDNPKVFKVLANAISSPNAFDNIVVFINRYFTRLGEELALKAEDDFYKRFPRYVAWLLPEPALAIPKGSKKRFVEGLRKFVDDVPSIDEVGLSEAFNQSINLFIKNIDDGTLTLTNFSEDFFVLRAFRSMHFIGGEQAINKLANQKGWTLGLNKVFDDEKLLKAFAEIDIQPFLTNTIDGGRAGINRIINQLDNRIGFKVTKGSMSHLMTIASIFKRQDGTKIKSIEVYDDVTAAKNGAELPTRRVDIEIELPSGRVVKSELKNIQANRLDVTLRNMMSKKPLKEAGEEAVEEAGQLLSDLVKYIDNGFSGRQLRFTPDVISGLGGVVPNVQQIENMQDLITDKIFDLFEKKQNRIAKEYFDLTIAGEKAIDTDVVKWRSIKNELSRSLDGEGLDGLPYVIIDTFEELL